VPVHSPGDGRTKTRLTGAVLVQVPGQRRPERRPRNLTRPVPRHGRLEPERGLDQVLDEAGRVRQQGEQVHDRGRDEQLLAGGEHAQLHYLVWEDAPFIDREERSAEAKVRSYVTQHNSAHPSNECQRDAISPGSANLIMCSTSFSPRLGLNHPESSPSILLSPLSSGTDSVVYSLRFMSIGPMQFLIASLGSRSLPSAGGSLEPCAHGARASRSADAAADAASGGEETSDRKSRARTWGRMLPIY